MAESQRWSVGSSPLPLRRQGLGARRSGAGVTAVRCMARGTWAKRKQDAVGEGLGFPGGAPV